MCETIDVSGEGISQHKVGNKRCSEGWCDGGIQYPKLCSCGGLIHAEFGDETYDGYEETYSVITKCDKCGCCG